MCTFGILGGNEFEVVQILTGMAGSTDAVFLNNEQCEADILIVNDAAQVIEAPERILKKNGMLIINSDRRELYTYIREFSGIAGKLVTYGFNGKACVTASSVMDDGVQICIRRALPTLSGATLCEREFTAPLANGSQNVSSVLAAATAALIAGLM